MSAAPPPKSHFVSDFCIRSDIDLFPIPSDPARPAEFPTCIRLRRTHTVDGHPETGRRQPWQLPPGLGMEGRRHGLADAAPLLPGAGPDRRRPAVGGPGAA